MTTGLIGTKMDKDNLDYTTDGCTFALNLRFRHCCKEHDFYYRNYVDITRREADFILYACMRDVNHHTLSSSYIHVLLAVLSKLTYFLLATYYFIIVRLFGWISWRGYGWKKFGWTFLRKKEELKFFNEGNLTKE